jgi:hypothetical protein
MPSRKTPQKSQEVTPGVTESLSVTPEWRGEKLFLAFPSYKTTNPVTTMCLLGIALDLGRDSLAPEVYFGDAMIYHARNRLAEKFLASKCEWSLWIDDDMVVPIGRPDFFIDKCRLPSTYSRELAGRHVVHRLMSHKQPFVCGMYVTRNNSGRVVASASTSSGVFAQINESSVKAGKLIPVPWSGSGCWLVHRSVFEAVKAKFPELAPTRAGQVWNFFKPLEDSRGEDQAFCARALEAGHQPQLDLGLQCMHIGYKAYGWGV